MLNTGKYTHARLDGWKPEEDKVLVSTVLQYIREGGTQLSAFGKVAYELNRTPAACGFRWNGTLRSDHIAEIKEAKRIRAASREAVGQDKKTSSHPRVKGLVLSKRVEELERQVREINERFENIKGAL